MKRGALALLALLAACNAPPEDQPEVDQCMRQQRFDLCMRTLPAGPVSTHYNDWSEVVEACESAAYSQSQRPRKLIKPECQRGRI